VQHQSVEVAGEHQVAAATEDEAAASAELRGGELRRRGDAPVQGGPAGQGEAY
jgi:hypothetical protein